MEEVKGIKNFGGYNDMPTPFRRIKVDEFLSRFITYSPLKIEHRQIYEKSLWEGYRCSKLLIYSDSIYVLTEKFTSCSVVSYEAFKCGCEHKFDTIENLGRCYNRYTCSLCGYITTIDSSD
jgi:hypothetical protein